MSFITTTAGICGDGVRYRMLVAVEGRSGRVNRLPVTIEWLSDNGSWYTGGNSHSFTRDIGAPRTCAEAP